MGNPTDTSHPTTTQTHRHQSPHTDTQCRMLQHCVILVLFLHGLETSPVIQDTQVNSTTPAKNESNNTLPKINFIKTNTSTPTNTPTLTNTSTLNNTPTLTNTSTLTNTPTLTNKSTLTNKCIPATTLNDTNTLTLDTNITQTDTSTLTNNFTVTNISTPAINLTETNNSTLPNNLTETSTIVTCPTFTNSTTITNTTIPTTMRGVFRKQVKCHCRGCVYDNNRMKCIKRGGGRCPCGAKRG